MTPHYSKTLEQWAGAARVVLAVVFTDIVGSTGLANLLGDENMENLRRAHFTRARRLINTHGGYETKTIGDSFMVVFHTAVDALNFALALHEYTGDARVKVRAGVHVGPVRVVENDVQGKMVAFTARLVSWPKDDLIVISDSAKTHVEDELGADVEGILFSSHTVNDLKGFPGEHRIWRIQRSVALEASEIDKESLTYYLHTVFADRPHAKPEAIPALVEELRAAGYATIGDVVRVIKKGWDAFLHYEPRRYIGNDLIIEDGNKDTRLSDVGVIRSLLYIADENFRLLSGQRFSESRMARINEARELLKE